MQKYSTRDAPGTLVEHLSSTSPGLCAPSSNRSGRQSEVQYVPVPEITSWGFSAQAHAQSPLQLWRGCALAAKHHSGQ